MFSAWNRKQGRAPRSSRRSIVTRPSPQSSSLWDYLSTTGAHDLSRSFLCPQPQPYKAADGFAPASLHTIETSAAEEQCQTALANALKTGFRNFKAGILSGNMVSSEAAVFAARYTFFSLYNVGPKTEPKTAVKKSVPIQSNQNPGLSNRYHADVLVIEFNRGTPHPNFSFE